MRSSRRRSGRTVGAVAIALGLVAMGAGCSSSDEDGGSGTTDTTAPTTSAVAVESAACDGAATPPALDTLQVDVDGTPRNALVHLPPGWDGTDALPVVVSFHGATSNAATMQAMDGFDATADAEQFIVVRPEGLVIDIEEQVTGITGWDLTAEKVDEPAFVATLLDELGSSVCIDPSRVYATGFSIGGEMAMAAACALPERIAAFASVGSSRSVPCESGTATPMLSFHGTSDLIAPYDGAPERGLQPTEDLLVEQAARNGCDDEPETTQVTPTVESDTWTNCDADVVLYRLDDHGHSWPGHPLPFGRELVTATLSDPDGTPNAVATWAGLSAEQMADNVLLTNTEVDATALMWEFFAANG